MPCINRGVAAVVLSCYCLSFEGAEWQSGSMGFLAIYAKVSKTNGMSVLLVNRHHDRVPVGTEGVLGDYIPFYFTPFSPMLLNIKSGRGGVRQRANDEIVILVSSLHDLKKQQIPFVFTNSHAYYQWTEFYTDLSDLD